MQGNFSCLHSFLSSAEFFFSKIKFIQEHCQRVHILDQLDFVCDGHLFHFLSEGVHIWHNNWLFGVNYNDGLRLGHWCNLGVERLGQI